jgi:DNA repair protein RadC
MHVKERIKKYGITAITDEEAINLLTGIPVEEIQKNIEDYGLPELIRFRKNMLLTSLQEQKLELLYHLSKRIRLADFKERPNLNTADLAGKYFVEMLQFYEVEVFAVCFLNNQNKLIKSEILFHGTVNMSHIYPREIIKKVLNHNASAVIVGHNHPSGMKTPSFDDISVTVELLSALKTIKVKLLDHIIVSKDKYHSMNEAADICFV